MEEQKSVREGSASQRAEMVPLAHSKKKKWGRRPSWAVVGGRRGEGVLAVANGRKHLEGLERLVRLEDRYGR